MACVLQMKHVFFPPQNRGSIPLSSEIHPVVELRDTNNKVPYFRGLDSATGFYPGSIPENSPPGQTVIEIKAYDDDPTYPNNFVSLEKNIHLP